MSTPPILCYHKVDPRLELGVTRVAPRVFRRQMEALAAAGARTLGSADLEHVLAGATLAGHAATAPAPGPSFLAPCPSPLAPSPSPLAHCPSPLAPRPSPLAPGPSLVLTFDDGYEPLARHAFPVLADLGFRALVFVVTDYVGLDNDWDVHYGWRRFRHLSWDDLAHWQERGIEVHSHGATHARLTWVSDAQAEDELGRSREAIARRLGGGAPPAGIAYPFGAVDARVRALAAAAGYSLGFAGPAGSGGRQPVGADRLALRRRPVYPWDASALPWVLREDVAGAFAMAAARFTSRCAVGTALFQRLLGARYTASR